MLATSVGWLSQTEVANQALLVRDGAPRDAPLLPTDEANQRGLVGSGNQPAPSPSQAPGTGSRSPADLSKIVRDGSLAIVIPDGTFDERYRQVVAIAERAGGFVLSGETRGDDSGALVLRIPADHLDEAFLAIRALGEPVASNLKGEDVTAEYVDLHARLRIERADRTFLLGLLGQADTIGESLTVKRQLDDVQLEIERLQGQLRFLEDQVAESTLKVDLRETSADASAVETDDGVANPSLGTALDRAVQGFLNVIATTLIGLGYLLPIAALGGLVYVVIRLVRRRGRAAS